MQISIIILTYNSSRYISSLLESLTSKYKKEILEKKLEILVADNSSQDDTVELSKKFTAVKTINNGGNFGYAKGNNLASKKAQGEILIFMNPDAKFDSGDMFELTETLEDKKVGIVGGKIIDFHGKNEPSCGKIYTLFNTLCLAFGIEEKVGIRFAPKKEMKVGFVSGAFLAIRRTLFEELHGFDEHYFMYIEDQDLCFRAKKLGYEVVFNPKAVIQHVGEGSSNRTFAVVNIYKGLLYFHKKHMGKASYEIVKSALKAKAILLVSLGKISHNKYLVETYEQAFKTT